MVYSTFLVPSSHVLCFKYYLLNAWTLIPAKSRSGTEMPERFIKFKIIVLDFYKRAARTTSAFLDVRKSNGNYFTALDAIVLLTSWCEVSTIHWAIFALWETFHTFCVRFYNINEYRNVGWVNGCLLSSRSVASSVRGLHASAAAAIFFVLASVAYTQQTGSRWHFCWNAYIF